MDTVQSLTPSGVIHAKRRAEELEMSAEAVADAGVEPTMARAVAARLRWKEGLGLKDHFKGVVPPTYKEALDAIEMKTAEKKDAADRDRIPASQRLSGEHGGHWLQNQQARQAGRWRDRREVPLHRGR